MKYLVVTFLLFSLSITAQDLKLKKILNQKESVKDTILSIQTIDKKVTVDLPVTLIKGKYKGPTFTIIAGIHGMEYPTINSLLEIRKQINPANLHGNLIIIPIVNITSFYKRTPFVNPIDNLNLNRVFPGKENGTITEVMAAFITKEIFSLTDILLDMHGGDVGEDLIPFICYYDNKEFDKQTKQVSKLSEISGFETIVCYPYTLADDQPAMYAFKQAVRQGIPSFSIELGKLGNSDKVEISFINEAIYRILKELKMYDNIGIKPTYGVKSKFSKQAYISVPVQGIF